MDEEGQSIPSVPTDSSLPDRELTFLSFPPLETNLRISSSLLTVKFTFHHPWRDVVKAFWHMTQPKVDPDLSFDINSALSISADPYFPPSPIPSSHFYQSSSDSFPSGLEHVKHTLLENWTNPNTSCTYLRRHIHIEPHIPAVLHRLFDSKDFITIEEHAILDPVNHTFQLIAYNVSYRHAIVIEESREFAIATPTTPSSRSPSHANTNFRRSPVHSKLRAQSFQLNEMSSELTTLSCRFQIYLLPVCGLLKQDVKKFVCHRWKLTQQSIGSHISEILTNNNSSSSYPS